MSYTERALMAQNECGQRLWEMLATDSLTIEGILEIMDKMGKFESSVYEIPFNKYFSR